MIYKANKQYNVKYVTNTGEEKTVEVTPENDMSVPAMIKDLKEKDENFFKLQEGRKIYIKEDVAEIAPVEEYEDMTAVQEEIENAVQQAEVGTPEDNVALEVTSGTIDVLIQDEKAAIEGYNAFLSQIRGTIPDVIFEVLEKEMAEIIKDEEDHINKLETIKSAFHFESAPIIDTNVEEGEYENE
jgi:hypothetical protein